MNKLLDHIFLTIQGTLLGITLLQAQSVVVMLCALGTFVIYFMINYEKVDEFVKKIKSKKK